MAGKPEPISSEERNTQIVIQIHTEWNKCKIIRKLLLYAKLSLIVFICQFWRLPVIGQLLACNWFFVVYNIIHFVIFATRSILCICAELTLTFSLKLDARICAVHPRRWMGCAEHARGAISLQWWGPASLLTLSTVFK